MTTTSFKPVQINQSTVQQNQPLVLKQGQVFHGTIKKIYPDQIAEVQVGQHKLFAKLESPLKGGDSHFFQVTNVNPQTELKMVTGPIQASKTTAQQMNQLLETMNLPKTTEMQQVLAQFIKNQLPIVKEQVVQAEIWLKNLSNSFSKQEALQAIQKMVESKFPFTEEVFKGLILGSKTNGISQAITNLTNLLKQDENIGTVTKTNLLQQLQIISKPLNSEVGGVILAKAIQLLNDGVVSNANKENVLNLLKAADIVSKDSTLNNWLSNSLQKASTTDSVEQTAGRIIQTITQSKVADFPQSIKQLQTWINNQPLLTENQKNNLQQLLSRVDTMPKTPVVIEQLAKQLQEQLTKAFAENTSNHLFKTDQHALSVKNHLLSLATQQSISNHQGMLSNLVNLANEFTETDVQRMATQGNLEVQSSLDSKGMEQAIKKVLKGLGMSYEASLNNKTANLQEVVHSLKPQLLALMQDEQASTGLREAAENIVGRLNGMQLQSGENGHQHQIVMQIPLNFLGKNTEGSIQWNGRMKDNGKIDSNFARILFYLDMEVLNETVVDMQVQNRVITINLYNDSPQLEMYSEPLKHALKKGLMEKEYQLSGLFFKTFEKTKTSNMELPSVKKTTSQNQVGVDIRI